MGDEKKFHVGIKALIRNAGGQIILMHESHKDNDGEVVKYWDFPGGRMQEGEAPLDTLRREVEEETGITEVTNPEFQAATISNHEIKLKDGDTVGLVLMVYRVTVPPDSVVKLSHEHVGYEWVDLAEAKKRLAHKYPQDFIAQL